MAEEPSEAALRAIKASYRQGWNDAVASIMKAAKEVKIYRAPAGTCNSTILNVLADGPLTVAEMATQTGISRPTIRTTLHRLAKQGEVEKAGAAWKLVDRSS